jgi:hypothetical protein
MVESLEINLKIKRYMKFSEMVLGDLLHFWDMLSIIDVALGHRICFRTAN